jgi:hypothetical protein
MRKNNYYEIDTIYDPEFRETYYYVYHQHPSGNRQIVSRYFRNHKSAEVLRDELNDDLYSEDDTSEEMKEYWINVANEDL